MVQSIVLIEAEPAKRACKDCEFAGQKQNYDDYPCQRSAPIAAKVESWQDPRMCVPRFPVMHGDDWCGEFKQK